MQDLPEDPNLIPPINFELIVKSRKQKKMIPVGVCASQAMDYFLAHTVSETEWNKLKDTNPDHSGKCLLSVFRTIPKMKLPFNRF